MEFSLVSTVFNEAKRLALTIADLNAQTLQPSEILITDAGSTDGTFEMLEAWQQKSSVPIVLFQKERCNVAEGRNIAIRAAKYELIASMDFGCRYHPDWLNSIITPFADPAVKVVGGNYSVDETDIKTVPARAAYILQKGYKTDIDSNKFVPSSRSIAYRIEVFNNIGGYHEWLTLAADDLIFGLTIKKIGYPIHIVNKVNAFWIRHTSTEAYVKEAYRYGLGNGEARLLFNDFRTAILRKVGWFVFILSTIIFLYGLIVLHKFLIIPAVIIVMLSYLFKIYFHYFKNWLRFRSEKYNFTILLNALALIGRIKTGYIKGYIKGYFYPTDHQKQEAIKLQNILNS